MMKNGYRTLLVACGLLGTLVGCHKGMLYPTMDDVKDFAKREAEGLKAHDDNMTEQHVKMHPDAEEAIRAQKAVFDTKMTELDKRLEEHKGRLEDLFEKLVANGLRLAGLGTTQANISAMVDGLQEDVEEEQDRGETLTTGGAVTDAKLNTINTKLSEVDQKRKTEIETALKGLDSTTTAKLEAASLETLRLLAEAGKDQAKREQILKDELKLTPEEIAQFKGMSTEAILGVILAAGGAAGIGIAGGKGGKSRSHVDIEKIKDSIAAIKADAELHKNKPS